MRKWLRACLIVLTTAIGPFLLLSSCSSVIKIDLAGIYLIESFDDLVVTNSPSFERRFDSPDRWKKEYYEVRFSFLVRKTSDQQSYKISTAESTFSQNERTWDARCKSSLMSKGNDVLKPGKSVRIDCFHQIPKQMYFRSELRNMSQIFLNVPYVIEGKTRTFQVKALSRNFRSISGHTYLAVPQWASEAFQALDGVDYFEARDWRNMDTSVSGEVGKACGIIFETRLISNRFANTLFLAVTNKDTRPKRLFYNSATYGIGKEIPNIRFEWEENVQPTQIEPNQTVLIGLPFQEKNIFLNNDHIKIRIPLTNIYSGESCEIQTSLRRSIPPYTPENNHTYHNFKRSRARMGFEFGRTLSRSLDLTEMGTNSFAAALIMETYNRDVHGFMMNVMWEFWGEHPSAKLESVTGKSHAIIGSFTFAMGYVVRPLMTSRFGLTYSIAPAVQLFFLNKNDENNEVVHFAMLQKVSLEYVANRKAKRFKRQETIGSLSLYQICLPVANIRGIPANGSSFGVLLGISTAIP